jgi:allantoicase
LDIGRGGDGDSVDIEMPGRGNYVGDMEIWERGRKKRRGHVWF